MGEGHISPINPDDLFGGNDEEYVESVDEFREEELLEKMPALADDIDFADGTNNPVELALLPSVDLIIGQLIAEPVQKGYKIGMEGRILKDKDILCHMEYSMIPDLNEGSLLTRGGYYVDKEKTKGTRIDEKLALSAGPDSVEIKGEVFTHEEGSGAGVRLNISSNSTVLKMSGLINNFPISASLNYEENGEIKHWGKLAGIEFQRSLIPDREAGGARLDGRIGDLEEKGQAIFLSEGSVLIDRFIGPYHVIQKVFIKRKGGG